jgi:hypothetical protein
MTAPRRRWSFGLRTLFVVVTLVACRFGYCLNWKQERDTFSSTAQSRRVLMVVYESQVTPPPWALRPFCGYGIGWIKVFDSPSKAQLAEEARRLFPEAGLTVEDSAATLADRP